jgi:hypothetical protein
VRRAADGAHRVHARRYDRAEMTADACRSTDPRSRPRRSISSARRSSRPRRRACCSSDCRRATFVRVQVAATGIASASAEASASCTITRVSREERDRHARQRSHRDRS